MTVRTKTQLSLQSRTMRDGSIDMEGLLTQLDALLRQIEDNIDQLNGLHGAVHVYNDVTIHGNLTVTKAVTSANGTTAPEVAV